MKTPFRITRLHHTDLAVAAMNDPACDKIWRCMQEELDFRIDEEPVPGVFYTDLSVRLMYPHEIDIVRIARSDRDEDPTEPEAEPALRKPKTNPSDLLARLLNRIK